MSSGITRVRRLPLLIAAIVAVPALAHALPPHAPRPGGIAVLDLGVHEHAPRVRFDDRRVMTVERDGRWHAIVGLPLDQPVGTADVRVDGEAGPRRIEVRPHGYREQHLTVAPSFVNPPPKTLERIAAERERIGGAITHFSDGAPEDLKLSPPVPGSRSDSFGSRRFFNDEPRSPHRGMDLSGNSGTPVHAALAGTVLEADNFYFTGNAVFLDHGQGLVTLYAHLDRIDVEPGARIESGQQVGTVGATGRVTGAHLHFATYLNGTPVDPALLLTNQQ